MNYQDTPEYRELQNMFHKLWTADVGTDGYDKQQWKALDYAMHRALAAAGGS